MILPTSSLSLLLCVVTADSRQGTSPGSRTVGAIPAPAAQGPRTDGQLPEGQDTALFWSYYSRGSLDRTSLLTGGYTRSSPAVWSGAPQLLAPRPPGAQALLLGHLARISQGPRRRRRAVSGPLYPRPIQWGSQQWQPLPWRTAVAPGPTGWARRVSLHLAGSLAQPPGWLENWLTGLLEFSQTHTVVTVVLEAVLLLAAFLAMVRGWGWLAESLGLVGEQRVQSRSDRVEVEEEERLVLRVVEGNWLRTLEDHVLAREELRDRESFLCCVFQEEEEESIECFPRRKYARRYVPEFRCRSQLKYDIAFNWEETRGRREDPG